MKHHMMSRAPMGSGPMGAGPQGGGASDPNAPPAPVTVTVPLEALGLADGVQDGAAAPGGSPGGQQGAPPALPGQGDQVQMVIEGTVASIDGGMATIAVTAVNGAPLDSGSGDDQAEGDPEEAQMRAAAQQQDDAGGY